MVNIFMYHDSSQMDKGKLTLCHDWLYHESGGDILLLMVEHSLIRTQVDSVQR